MRLSLIPILLGATLGVAQDVRINSSTGDQTSPPIPSVLAVANTATTDTAGYASGGKVAVYGISQPTYSKGIGVEGVGASRGILGIGSGPSYPAGQDNVRIGVYGTATGGWSNVGIWGQETSLLDYAGYFSGNVTVTGNFQNLSDSLLKKNIQPMPPALNKLMDLKPKTYEMDGSKTPHTLLAQGPQDGVLAQDVATVFPELVKDVPIFSGDPSQSNTTATNYKSVNYMGLIPILIKAVQEQQAEIDTLQQKIRALKGQ